MGPAGEEKMKVSLHRMIGVKVELCDRVVVQVGDREVELRLSESHDGHPALSARARDGVLTVQPTSANVVDLVPIGTAELTRIMHQKHGAHEERLREAVQRSRQPRPPRRQARRKRRTER